MQPHAEYAILVVPQVASQAAWDAQPWVWAALLTPEERLSYSDSSEQWAVLPSACARVQGQRAVLPCSACAKVVHCTFPHPRWTRFYEMQLQSLRMLIENTLLALPRYARGGILIAAPNLILTLTLALTPTRYKKEGISLYVPGSVVAQRFTFPPNIRLRVSSANRGAAAAAEEIRAVYPSLVVEGNTSLTRAPSTVMRSWSMAISRARAAEQPSPQATSDASAQANTTEAMLLLYLNKDTFVDRNGAALADQVRAARRDGVRVFMLHETSPEKDGCSEFAHFFQTTPQDLIDGGLFDALAIGMAAEPNLRKVSLAIAAKALGARTDKNHSRSSLLKSATTTLDLTASAVGLHSSAAALGDPIVLPGFP